MTKKELIDIIISQKDMIIGLKNENKYLKKKELLPKIIKENFKMRIESVQIDPVHNRVDYVSLVQTNDMKYSDYLILKDLLS